MIGNKLGIVVLMTFDARRQDVGRFELGVWQCKGMTRATGDARLAVITLMIDQRKTKLIVRENIGR